MITRITRTLARWHAGRSYLAALFGRDEEANRQERLHELAKKIAEQEK